MKKSLSEKTNCEMLKSDDWKSDDPSNRMKNLLRNLPDDFCSKVKNFVGKVLQCFCPAMTGLLENPVAFFFLSTSDQNRFEDFRFLGTKTFHENSLEGTFLQSIQTIVQSQFSGCWCPTEREGWNHFGEIFSQKSMKVVEDVWTRRLRSIGSESFEFVFSRLKNVVEQNGLLIRWMKTFAWNRFSRTVDRDDDFLENCLKTNRFRHDNLVPSKSRRMLNLSHLKILLWTQKARDKAQFENRFFLE